MITDDVRRETAKKLREKKKEFFGKRSWFPQDLILYQSMYLTAIDECLPDGECGFDVLADLIDRGECENVYDENEMGACDNGFECSVCGCRVEDEEHYRVSGVWNYCPQCGRTVVKP